MLKLALVSLLCVFLSTPGVIDAQEIGAAPSAKSSPEALEILTAAIAHQGPEEFAKPGAIRDLSVRIQAEVTDHGKSPPATNSLGIERFLILTPGELFLSVWITTAGRQTYGFDGKRHWYADRDDAIWLVGDKRKKELKRVQDERAETKYLLRFFFLANLKGGDAIFEKKPDQVLEAWGRKIPCRVLHRTNHAAGAAEPDLALWFDAKTNALLKAEALARKAGERTLSFLFRYSEEIQPRVKGVLVPFRIEIRERPWGAKRDRTSTVATLEEDGGIEFNTGLKPEMFLRPKKK